MNRVKTASEALLKTQMDILFENSRWLIVGQISSSTIMFIWLWGQVDTQVLALWYGLSFLPPLCRVLLTRLYLSDPQQRGNILKKYYLLGSFIYGTIWGSLVFLDINTNGFYFILLSLAGLMAVTVASSSVYLPAVTFFIMPVGTQISLRCLIYEIQMPDQGWLFVFLFTSIASLALVASARVLNRSLVNGLNLRFENLELVQQLTEQKIEIEQARAIAEQANIDKSRFLAVASHDLHQPLHSMNLFLDAIQYSNSQQERTQLYGKLESSLQSLTELFDALLDISKLDDSSIDIQHQPVSISATITKLFEEFEMPAQQKGIELRYRPTDLIGYSDPLWLERILRNLISNALCYTESGKILISCRRRGGDCLIQVWDTGHGIAEEQQALIFQEFTQIHNPQGDQNKGLGLGLAIVQRLCLLLGHKVCVRSAVDRGTVFSITLPLSTQPLEKTESDSHRRTQHSLQDKQVLVIDGDLDIRTALATLLSKWGCKTILADSFDSVVRQLDEQKPLPDAIICNYHLPNNYTGLELLQQMQQHYGQSIPTLFTTADTAPETINTIHEGGFRLLYKPVQPAKLRILLNSLLQT